MRINARFYVASVRKAVNGPLEVQMLPCTRGEDNVEWKNYSPSGEFKLNVKPESAAAEFFESNLGKDLAITFELRDPTEIA